MPYKDPERGRLAKRAWTERNREKMRAYWRERSLRLRDPNSKGPGDHSTNATGRKPRPLAGAGLQKALARQIENARIELEGTKTCRTCLKTLPIADFYKSEELGEVFYYTRCRSCHTGVTGTWSKENIEIRREITRRSQKRWHYQAVKYGITPQDYENMVAAQSGLCAICNKPELNKRLAIDHDHTTEKVRELLCSRCNTSIGKFEDSPELLRKAADYIEKHSKVTS